MLASRYPWSAIGCAALFCFAAACSIAAEIDHSPWDAFATEVVQDGLVDYSALVDQTGILDEYLHTLGQADLTSATQKDTLALCLNAYTVITIRLALRHYNDIASLDEIETKWDYPPRTTAEWLVAGKTVSLESLREWILQRGENDPRLLFVLADGTRTGARVRAEAFWSDQIDEQLDDMVRQTCASATHLTFDRSSQTLALAHWMQPLTSQFKSPGEFLAWLLPFCPEDIQATIAPVQDAITLAWLPEDRTLNKMKTSNAPDE